jgi:hypothetical protein
MAKKQRNAKWAEVGWLIGQDMKGLLEKFREFRRYGEVSQRKCCLYDIACARRVMHLFPDDVCREIVEFCERCVEKPALRKSKDWKRFQSAVEDRREAIWRAPTSLPPDALNPLSRAAYDLVSRLLGFPPHGPSLGQNETAVWAAAKLEQTETLQIATLRDVFGNPFSPVACEPEWRTDTAIALARTMYESREFSAMPILADALQDAGCDNTDILNHCRDTSQVHVRGCWVVDLVLGKT